MTKGSFRMGTSYNIVLELVDISNLINIQQSQFIYVFTGGSLLAALH